ncbi:hypothetical protein Tco_1352901 [Tanacetum coccineum]
MLFTSCQKRTDSSQQGVEFLQSLIEDYTIQHHIKLRKTTMMQAPTASYQEDDLSIFLYTDTRIDADHSLPDALIPRKALLEGYSSFVMKLVKLDVKENKTALQCLQSEQSMWRNCKFAQ